MKIGDKNMKIIKNIYMKTDIRDLKKEMKKIKNGYYKCKLELMVISNFSDNEYDYEIITINSIDYDDFESTLTQYMYDNQYKGFYSRIITVIDLKVLEWEKKEHIF